MATDTEPVGLDGLRSVLTPKRTKMKRPLIMIVRAIVSRDQGMQPAGVPSEGLPLPRRMVLDMLRRGATGERPIRSAILQADDGTLYAYEFKHGKASPRRVELKRRGSKSSAKPSIADKLRMANGTISMLEEEDLLLQRSIESARRENDSLAERKADAERERDKFDNALCVVLAKVGDIAVDKARTDAAEQALRDAERAFAADSERDRDELIRLRACLAEIDDSVAMALAEQDPDERRQHVLHIARLAQRSRGRASAIECSVGAANETSSGLLDAMRDAREDADAWPAWKRSDEVVRDIRALDKTKGDS